jgi:flagellar protein FliS
MLNLGVLVPIMDFDAAPVPLPQPPAAMSYAQKVPTPRSNSYRELELQGASSERLVVFVFEQLVVNLERARIAVERKDLGMRVQALRRARGLVTELLATLDFEQGGPLAQNLASLYQFMLVELVDVGDRGDLRTMRSLINVATSLRDGFAGAAAQLAVRQVRSA